MGFNPTLIELGELKPRKEIEFHFDYGIEVSYITSINTPCDCTRVKNDTINRRITVNYMPKEIPPQRKKFGYYDTIKTITIRYVNIAGAELNVALVFTATIKK